MSFANTSTVRYSVRCNDGGADQILQVRLSYVSRLISRSPSAGLPYDILQETSPTPMADVPFHLPLRRHIEDPWLCQVSVVQLLSSFNLGIVACNAIARKITSFVVQLAARNLDVKFQIVADIDYIQIFWIDRSSVPVRESVRRGVMVEETVILEEAVPVPAARRGAPESAMERLKNEKLDEFGEEGLGDCICSVCFEEVKGVKNVAKIPCGHVYHKSCILTWLKNSNSCPLCRRPLQE